MQERRAFIPQVIIEDYSISSKPCVEHQVKQPPTVELGPHDMNMKPSNQMLLPLFHFRRALNLGILRDPGSEVEDRQYQLDLQSITIGTAHWEQLKPEKEGVKGSISAESERSSQNPALEWNMASRSEVISVFECSVRGMLGDLFVPVLSRNTEQYVTNVCSGVFSGFCTVYLLWSISATAS